MKKLQWQWLLPILDSHKARWLDASPRSLLTEAQDHWYTEFRPVATNFCVRNPLQALQWNAKMLAIAFVGVTAIEASELQFQPPVSYTGGTNLRPLDTADFNQDGIPDLATIDYVAPGDLKILLGIGDGTFSTLPDWPIGVASRSLVVEDLNGDAIPDVVSAHIGSSASLLSNRIMVSLGNGDGTFMPPVAYSVGAFSPIYVRLGDVNGDGIIDAVTANYDSGTFTPGSLSILSGNSDGTFSNVQIVPLPVKPITVDLSDINNDGELDFIVSTNSALNPVMTVLNGADNSFSDPASVALPHSPNGSFFSIAKDMDGDGNMDLVVGSRDGPPGSGRISVVPGAGDGRFLPGTNYQVPLNPYEGLASDINNDGTPDIILVSFSSRKVSVLIGNGDGSMQPVQRFETGRGPTALQVADFNSDNLVDIATTNNVSDNISVLLNATGDGMPPIADAGPDQAVRAADLVQLNGSGSYDETTPSSALIYQWQFISFPGTTQPILTGANTATANFPALELGQYELQLVVTDEAGNVSAPDSVLISNLNEAPTAIAGQDIVVQVLATVQLDGSGSFDPEGDPLTYQWQIISAPVGSAATLTNAALVTPQFIPNIIGEFVIALTVSDPIGEGSTDSVSITVVDDLTSHYLTEASTEIEDIDSADFDSTGHQNTLGNFIDQALSAYLSGNNNQAVKKIEDAIERVDGCALRGAPDLGNNPRKDYVTVCSAQFNAYELLTLALDSMSN